MKNNDLAKKLLSMKEKIENAQTEKNKLEGQLFMLTDRLKQEHQLPTIAEAVKKLESMKKEYEKIYYEMNSLMDALENDYEW